MSEPDEPTLDAILAPFYEGSDPDPDGDLHYTEVRRRNVLNATITGTVMVEGVEYAFEIEDGDSNGTVVHQWCPVEEFKEVEHEESDSLYFVPRDARLWVEKPRMFEVYVEWTKSKWFRNKVREINHSRYFDPGFKSQPYSEWAAGKGLAIGSYNDAMKMIDDHNAILMLGGFDVQLGVMK